MGKKITKDFGLTKLIEYYNILGKIPIRDDFKKNKWSPHYDWYTEQFGSMKNACFEAGLINKPLSDQERINISIEKLIEIANKLNRCPIVSEYENIKHEGFVRRVLEDKLKLKYNDICRKYISQYNINNVRGDATKEELIEDLITLKNKLGRTPMLEEICRNNGLYSYNVYERVFNKKFSDIIKEMGWELIGHEPIIRSKEELLNDFLKLFNKLGKLPYSYEINKEPNMASYSTYIKYFGSIENVCKILNIDYQKYFKGSGAGKVIYDKNNEICKSYIERDITNFFIDNNIKYSKETLYKSIISNCKKRIRLDWKIEIDYGIKYIEYFGMFRKNPRGGIDNRYTKLAKEKIKLIKNNNLIDDFIFIYPEDIENKTLIEIFKPYFNKQLIENKYEKFDDKELIKYEYEYLYKKLNEIDNNFGRFLTLKEIQNDLNFKNIFSKFYKYGGYVYFQLYYLEEFLNRNKKLKDWHIEYLTKVINGHLQNKQKSNIEQINKSKEILDNYNK